MQVGFFGKLPSHGDFLRRRTSDAFVQLWDAWLQECMAATRETLGASWLDVYLTSPAWRFAAAPGLCGDGPILGLIAPSVDRVGRYFPITIVAELPPDVSLMTALPATGPFYDAAERTVIDALEAEPLDFEQFDREIGLLAETLLAASAPQAVTLDASCAVIMDAHPHAAWQLPIASSSDIGAALNQVALHRLAVTHRPLFLSWTDGSAVVEPSCLVSGGLPQPEAFVALLDGAWQARRWQTVSGSRILARSADLPADTPLSIRSAAASDTGKVRQINQDAYLERGESGLWAVADGLGGHSDGELASRMVCDALADLPPAASLDDAIKEVRARMQAVNEHLLLAAARTLRGDRSGSTVVVLVIRGRRAAILWAGDSRVYRWRGGQLLQLTRDHSPGADGRWNSNAVTRAVGGQSAIELDVLTEPVRPGDRFLLCSDGLTRAVPEDRIGVHMEIADPRAAVDALIRTTLAAGAPDNVTALIVEAAEG